MKKSILFVVITLLSISTYAQRKIGEATLQNGKVILVFDDMTWMYRDAPASFKKTNTTSGTSATKPKSSSNSIKSTPSTLPSYSSACGARTKSGGSCRRIVKGGGRCWQHGG